MTELKRCSLCGRKLKQGTWLEKVILACKDKCGAVFDSELKFIGYHGWAWPLADGRGGFLFQVIIHKNEFKAVLKGVKPTEESLEELE